MMMRMMRPSESFQQENLSVELNCGLSELRAPMGTYMFILFGSIWDLHVPVWTFFGTGFPPTGGLDSPDSRINLQRNEPTMFP